MTAKGASLNPQDSTNAGPKNGTTVAAPGKVQNIGSVRPFISFNHRRQLLVFRSDKASDIGQPDAPGCRVRPVVMQVGIYAFACHTVEWQIRRHSRMSFRDNAACSRSLRVVRRVPLRSSNIQSISRFG